MSVKYYVSVGIEYVPNWNDQIKNWRLDGIDANHHVIDTGDVHEVASVSRL